jgi:RNA polymerase-binding protein DksA
MVGTDVPCGGSEFVPTRTVVRAAPWPPACCLERSPRAARREGDAVNEAKRRALIHDLRERRERILSEVADTERDLRALADERESEIEERAQETSTVELLARLDDVAQQRIEEIDETLRRISAGTYGICHECHERISPRRLDAIPTTLLCIDCARGAERAAAER